MCGSLYLGIAKSCLQQLFPEMSSTEISELLARGDFDEIEGYIGVEEAVKAAVEGFNGGCEAVHLPQYFHLDPDRFMNEVVMNEFNPAYWQSNYDMMANAARLRDYDRLTYAALLALNTIHDNWVVNHSWMFFDKAQSERRFMFLPLQFIGWGEARQYLVFLMPILNKIGLQISETSIESMYGLMRTRMSSDELTRFIRHIRRKYQILDKKIVKSMRDEAVARQIAEQSIARF